MNNRYHVVVAGGNGRTLYQSNDMTMARSMQSRWGIQLRNLGVDVILLDMETGEVLAGL